LAKSKSNYNKEIFILQNLGIVTLTLKSLQRESWKTIGDACWRKDLHMDVSHISVQSNLKKLSTMFFNQLLNLEY